MCPDRQMLSLYFDKELPSPWKGQMEDHLGVCADCRDRLEQYRRLSQSLGTASPSGFDTAAKERLWLRIAGMAEKLAERNVPNRLWNRSVAVPVPLVAAAAVMVFVFSFFFIRGSVPAAPHDPAMAALDMQTIVPVSDMSRIIQYLGNEDPPDIVIIRLPESSNFMSSGEPAIIRAADYAGRKRTP